MYFSVPFQFVLRFTHYFTYSCHVVSRQVQGHEFRVVGELKSFEPLDSIAVQERRFELGHALQQRFAYGTHREIDASDLRRLYAAFQIELIVVAHVEHLEVFEAVQSVFVDVAELAPSQVQHDYGARKQTAQPDQRVVRQVQVRESRKSAEYERSDQRRDFTVAEIQRL